ncbi:MAG: D-glucuronyl C5-epimerase family protein [bacterium]|nr:D-glucuronyl C5-epimerase family protein [bacterium]
MKLDCYHIDLNQGIGEDFSQYEFDENGIPLTRYQRQPNWKHNPVTVCQYGLFLYNRWLRSHEQKSKKLFLSQATWLVQNAEPGSNGALVWYYRFDLPYYQIKSPWISGMAQGEALSLLLRAHQITADDNFFTTAEKAWCVFENDVQNGGVISTYADGQPVIEEYPSLHHKSCVLNGFIFGLLGVYDYFIYADHSAARELFYRLISSLKNNLFRYDSGYWTYYDLKYPLRLASKTYHLIHLEQLKTLHKLTGESFFEDCYQQWQAYHKSIKCNLKWMLRKFHQKLILRI